MHAQQRAQTNSNREIASELASVRERFRGVKIGTDDYAGALEFARIKIDALEAAHGDLGVEITDYVDKAANAADVSRNVAEEATDAWEAYGNQVLQTVANINSARDALFALLELVIQFKAEGGDFGLGLGRLFGRGDDEGGVDTGQLQVTIADAIAGVSS